MLPFCGQFVGQLIDDFPMLAPEFPAQRGHLADFGDQPNIAPPPQFVFVVLPKTDMGISLVGVFRLIRWANGLKPGEKRTIARRRPKVMRIP